MRETSRKSFLSITTRDVGLTQVATVWIGETRIAEFYTATKHEERSLENAEAVVSHALWPLLEKSIEEDQYARIWTGTPGGDLWTDE